MAGKGSTPRPVDPKKFADNWDRIFKKHDNCGTDECCMTCDTAAPSAVDDAATAVAKSFVPKQND